MANNAPGGDPGAREWLVAENAVTPKHGSVDLWRAELGLEPCAIERLALSLSAGERSRAARFRFPKDQARFKAARGILRDILSRYTGQDPGRIEFGYGPRGKPFLLPGGPAGVPEFNVSHSGQIALYAITAVRPVGVDVEEIRPGVESGRIAERFFTPWESAALRALPPAERAPAFFRCWTRKEAYVKAIGEGLRSGLRTCEVSLEAGDSDALREVGGDPSAANRWSIADVAIGWNCAAAFAIEEKNVERRFFHWAERLR